MPRNVQKDHEASLAWNIKDQLLRRGKVYYAKLARGRATFVAPRMLPYFHAIWGVRKADEAERLSKPARAILKVLRHEWEMGTADLRNDSGIKDRAAFTRALDELQAAMLVIPCDVVDQPVHVHLDARRGPVSRCAAPAGQSRGRGPRNSPLFSDNAGLTVPGELARVTGLSRPEAGLGNRALVAEGFATMLAPGRYTLCSLSS